MLPTGLPSWLSFVKDDAYSPIIRKTHRRLKSYVILVQSNRISHPDYKKVYETLVYVVRLVRRNDIACYGNCAVKPLYSEGLVV